MHRPRTPYVSQATATNTELMSLAFMITLTVQERQSCLTLLVQTARVIETQVRALRVVQRVVFAGIEVEKEKKIVRLPESVNVLSLSVNEAEGGDVVPPGDRTGPVAEERLESTWPPEPRCAAR